MLLEFALQELELTALLYRLTDFGCELCRILKRKLSLLKTLA